MTTNSVPEKIFVVPGLPDYSASLDGLDVYRMVPAKRGPTAGIAPYRMTPVKLLRGADWFLQFTQPDGKRKRISVPNLAKMMLDAYGATCDSLPTE
jgi:hypothetical protein